MTYKEYEKHNGKFFIGKEVTTNRKITSNGGEYILKNEICTITRKYRGFDICNASGIRIKRVQPKDVDFYQPI